MNIQEKPVAGQEPFATEEYPLDAEKPHQEEKPSPSSSPPYELARPATPPSSIPYMQSPHTWPAYTPGTWQPWRSGSQFVPPSPPRRRSGWPWIVLILVLLFMLLTGGAIFLASNLGYNLGSSVSETQHFSVSANPTLVLTNDTGSIQVRAGGTGLDVSIQATKHSGSGGNLNDIHINYAQNTGSNTVTVNVERLNNASFFGSGSVDFAITVPSTATLQLKTNTGSIDVSGVSGQMVLTSNTGSVQASGGALGGTSEFGTNTGSITFTGSIGSSGTYRFQTNTGSVNVTLPGASVFHLDASTDTGSINTNFPGVTVQHRQFVGADAQSDVGAAPQATLSLKTNTGSINLFQR